MATPKLDSLPTEVLWHVAGYVHSAYPRSLHSFALLNKTCHAAAITWLSRNIHFKILNRRKLREDVNRCLESLASMGSLKHVRWLEIKGSMAPRLSEDAQEAEAGWTRKTNTWYGAGEIFGERENGIFMADEPVWGHAEEDQAWSPLVRLLKVLPHLKDLVFNSYAPFPPCLLDALHKYQPQCRLHLVKFRFRSLRAQTTDAHEMAVATSPCLHTIGVRWVDRDSAGHDDYNQEAAMRLVGGLAPNLKRVQMMHCRRAFVAHNDTGRGRPRVPWKGFSGDDNGITPASLESLTLQGFGKTSLDGLKVWQRHASFASLRSLSLEVGMGGEALRWAATNMSFSSLTELTINLEPGDKSELTPNFGGAAVAFLASLPPLERLELLGVIEPEILDCILERHGKSLRRLSLKPTDVRCLGTVYSHSASLSRVDVLHLQECCPILEDLTMSVKRSMGDTNEVEIYMALARMERLKTAFLTLDCSTPLGVDYSKGAGDGSSDNWAQEIWDKDIRRRLRKGHIRDGLLNSAVDESLARAIWDTISSAKIGKRLESLKLCATGGVKFGTEGYPVLMNVMQHLGRSYLFQRSIRDDDDGFTVQELDRRAREVRDERERMHRRKLLARYADNYSTGEPEDPFHLRSVMEIIGRTWPAKEGSRDWRDDWASLPLQR